MHLKGKQLDLFGDEWVLSEKQKEIMEVKIDRRGNKRIVMLGKTYGNLTVIEEFAFKTERNRQGHRKCKVRCHCGREFDAVAYNVRNGFVKRCPTCSGRDGDPLEGQLTPEKMQNIRDLLIQGLYKPEEIAKMFGVNEFRVIAMEQRRRDKALKKSLLKKLKHNNPRGDSRGGTALRNDDLGSGNINLDLVRNADGGDVGQRVEQGAVGEAATDIGTEG